MINIANSYNYNITNISEHIRYFSCNHVTTFVPTYMTHVSMRISLVYNLILVYKLKYNRVRL